jgi:transposase
MIVLGADTHKRSHTIAAVAAGTGELLGEQTVAVGRRGFGALLRWARGLDGERVWAIEDCRNVSGSLERFLIERGERVLRIPTHLSAGARKSARQRQVGPDRRAQPRSRRAAGWRDGQRSVRRGSCEC